MSEMIALNNLSKWFGDLVAVDRINLSVGRGEVLGFLGPNGAGKSTTMKMVAGFLEPSDGSAIVCGHDVVKQPVEVKKRIGYLPEGAPTYGDMTPRGFLKFIAEIRGFDGAGEPGDTVGRPCVIRHRQMRQHCRRQFVEARVEVRVIGGRGKRRA